MSWNRNIAPLTIEQYQQMRANSLDQAVNDVSDRRPVVKFFTPDAQCTWLLTEIDEDGRCFGLCDLGQGEPELGYVMLQELQDGRGFLGLPIEVDLHFVATKGLDEYAKEARIERRIVT